MVAFVDENGSDDYEAAGAKGNSGGSFLVVATTGFDKSWPDKRDGKLFGELKSRVVMRNKSLVIGFTTKDR